MLVVLVELVCLASARKHRRRAAHSNGYEEKDWAALKGKLDVIAQSKAEKFGDKLRAKKLNSMLMNSILYRLGIAGPMDVTDPISLAFIRSHKPNQKPSQEGDVKGYE